MFILVLSMDVLGAFLIPCRSQWRTSFCQVRTMHVEHQMENMVPRKAEIQSWGILRDRQCPSEHCQASEHLSAPHATEDAHG